MKRAPFLLLVPAFFVAGALLPNGLPLGVVLLGVVLGSLQALTALGLVLLYRSSRIINLAQAEIGGLAAATAVILVAGNRIPYLLALPIGLGVAALTGVLIDATVIRRLFHAPRLIVMVATIGLAEVLGAAEIFLPHIWGHLRPFTTFHAPISVSLRVGPLVFDADHFVAVGVTAVAVALLWWFLVRSDLGVAVRGAADSQDRAALLGIPIKRLSRLTWMVAAMLSGASAMLSAPILGANVGVAAGPVALLVPLAAAVIAGMESLPGAALAAIGLTIFEQAVFWSYPRSSVVDVCVFGFVLAGLVLQRRRPGREDDSELGSFVAAAQARPIDPSVSRLPAVVAARIVIAGAIAVGLGCVLLFCSNSELIVAAYIAIYGIVAISLVVLTGWAGQISLGQFAFVAVGAATAGGLYVNAGVDLTVAIVAATAIGALAAIVIGTPALRLPGPLLAVATLAFAVPVSTWLINPSNFPALTPANIPRPVLFGHIALSSPRTFALVCFIVALVAWLLMANLRRTRAGRAVIAVRDNERAAASYGVDPTRIRLMAFAIAGGLCGLAGGLYAIALRGIGFAGFDPSESIQAFTMVVVGGLGSLGTALVGAAYVRGAQYVLHGALQLFATGAGLLVLLLFIPGGLGGIITACRDRFLRWAADQPLLCADAVFSERTETDGWLRAADIDAAYGPVQVLFGASIGVQRGEILALLGTNGAGKSTLLKVIAGLLPADAGSVHMGDLDLSNLDAAARASRGVALMPGGKAVFPSLTVDENLRLGSWLHDSDYSEVFELFPVLSQRRSTRAGLLSGGQQQMLGLSMALLSRPSLLLIDELSLGLAPSVVSQLLAAVRSINENGTTVVIVEQSLDVAASIAPRAVFMERGAVRFVGPTRELLDRDDLARAVFLPPPHAVSVATPSERVALSVRELAVSFGGIRAVDGVDLTVPAGTVVGIIGSNGAGKTTLLDAVSGFVPVATGTVLLGEANVSHWSPAARANAGLGRSYQGARLFPSLTVAETLSLALERHIDVREPFASALALAASRRSERAVRERVDELITSLALETYRDSRISELSTGTRRIVELGCAMAHEPSVLLLDEPSSGLAQRETEALAPVLSELRDTLGAAMVIVEHDIGFVSSIADSLVCLHLGSVLATGSPDAVLGDPAVIASYMSSSVAGGV
jgi:ABC-type branched-subunit amino acid transport system ATPase component/ABC-type branched-subunit amino acid transport system permease subunit